MSANWYYVLDNERVGPVLKEELKRLYDDGILFEESFVWQKGFDNWKHIQDVAELEELYKKVSKVEAKVVEEISKKNSEAPAFNEDLTLHLTKDTEENNFKIPKEKTREIEVIESTKVPAVEVKFNWHTVSSESKIFTLKVGIDRNGAENEYGPYSLSLVKKLFDEKRINGKTLIFSPGMDDWTFLADIPIFEKLFFELPPIIDEVDRRKSKRKPFVARLLFHDHTEVFEGICRDISIGGLQILVADCPLTIGSTISMNVHPDNRERSFVAQGKIVRALTDNLGFSLRFLGLNDEAKKSIEEYTNQN